MNEEQEMFEKWAKSSGCYEHTWSSMWLGWQAAKANTETNLIKPLERATTIISNIVFFDPLMYDIEDMKEMTTEMIDFAKQDDWNKLYESIKMMLQEDNI